ncbi:MAG: hypothetical protein WAW17_05840 [Rhodococcus sp. (in: high G+C Gram-positive bacteria)]|uniref:hypothetical protein n=1 Tax=Rhodococcus sp. TaxID=1831 RepID=UPI003BAEC1DD
MIKPPDRGVDGTEVAGRLRRLTQAALNADVTMGRVDGVADEIGNSLDEFHRVLSRFEAMLDKFSAGLDGFADTVRSVDELVGFVAGTDQDLDQLLLRIGRIVETVDWLLTPAVVARRQLSRLRPF